MRAYLLTTTATMALLAATSSTHAQTSNWTGAVSNDWFNAGNWNAGVPALPTNAIIDTVSPNPTVVAASGVGTALNLTVGQSGTGNLTIRDGGTVSNVLGAVGNLPGSQGTVTVTGPGSTWTNGNAKGIGNVVVGGLGTGTLAIENGGTVISTGGSSVGLSVGSTGTVTVTGAGSSWNNVLGLNIGSFGTGTLTIADGGTVTPGGPFRVASNAGSIGTLNIGAGAGDPAVAPGTLNAASVAFGAGVGTLNFNHTSNNYTFAPAISGNGSVNVLAGTTILTANNTYTGATTVNGGALIVNGSIALSSLTTVNSGAALLGSGTVGSTVINSGGFLVPGPVGTPGTMTVTGNLAFQSGALYVVQVNPTTASNTNVSGTASLAGTVGAIFAPGSYMVRSYTILTAAAGAPARSTPSPPPACRRASRRA